MDEKLELKKQLKDACYAYINERIANIQTALSGALEAGNTETKSSAGDKHETGRAMMHLEQEKNAHQLAEASKVKRALYQMQEQEIKQQVGLGALVKCNTGLFFISIGAGRLKIDNTLYYAVGSVSPIALALLGKKMGDEIVFNGKTVVIEEVF